jgi:glycosyltransferase involved in cell wall biosynthesis
MPAASLVIPCYNESKNLPLLIERCDSVFKGRDVEVILVDNGSKDSSPSVIAQALDGHPFIRSIRVEVNQGYGFGILTGLHASCGAIVGWTHADMQTDPNDFLRGLEVFSKSRNPRCLLVKGRRYGRPLADRFFTFGMSVFETCLFGKVFWDINAQPTMFPRELYLGWSNPPIDFSLDLFAYFSAKQAGYTVRRIRVKFGSRAHGVSSWNVNFSAKRKFIKRTLDFSFELRRRLRQSRSGRMVEAKKTSGRAP